MDCSSDMIILQNTQCVFICLTVVDHNRQIQLFCQNKLFSETFLLNGRIRMLFISVVHSDLANGYYLPALRIPPQCLNIIFRKIRCLIRVNTNRCIYHVIFLCHLTGTET